MTPLASRWAHIGLRNVLARQGRGAGATSIRPTGPPSAPGCCSGWARPMPRGCWSRSVDTDRFTPKMVQVAVQVALANSDPSALCPLETRLAKVEPRMAPLVTAMCASLAGESERAAADIEQARRRGRVSAIDLALADKVVGAGAEYGARGDDRMGAGRPAQLLALRPVDRDRDDAARAADQRRRARRCAAWLARAPMFSATQKMAAARTAAALGVMSSDAMVDLYSAAYDATDPDELGGTDPWQLRLAFVGKDRDARLSAMRGLWGNAQRPRDADGGAGD